MATREQLESALQKADSAGDVEAARMLAGAIKAGDYDQPEDTFAQNALDVAGEFAAGANRTLMWVPDTVVKAINQIPGVDIPTPSEMIESVSGYMPGEGGFMEPGTARNAVAAAGEVLAPGAMGMYPVQRNLASLPQAAAEFAGLGTAKAPASIPIIDAGLDKAAQRNVSRDLAVKTAKGDVAGAGFKLDPDGNVVRDAAQELALKKGLSRGVVAQVAQAGKADKSKVNQMLDIVDAGLKNKTVGDFNLPRQVLGDSMYSRYSVVEEVNERAARAVGREAQALKDIPFDAGAFTDGPIRSFLEDLRGLDVVVSPTGKLDFSRSAFRGSPGAQKVIRKTVKDLFKTQAESLYDVHTLKQFIDDMVEEYGKSSGGLSGRADRVVKRFRHNLNEFMRQRSTAYAEANDIFSETIDILNEADRLVGRNNAVDPRSLARTARKAVSNYATGDQVMDLLVDLDDVAKKYGADFADDLKTQVSVVQTIEQLFPTARPPASFAGDISKTLDYAKRSMTGGKAGAAMAAVDATVDAAKKKLGKGEDERLAEMVKIIRGLAEDSAK